MAPHRSRHARRKPDPTWDVAHEAEHLIRQVLKLARTIELTAESGPLSYMKFRPLGQDLRDSEVMGKLYEILREERYQNETINTSRPPIEVHDAAILSKVKQANGDPIGFALAELKAYGPEPVNIKDLISLLRRRNIPKSMIRTIIETLRKNYQVEYVAGTDRLNRKATFRYLPERKKRAATSRKHVDNSIFASDTTSYRELPPTIGYGVPSDELPHPLDCFDEYDVDWSTPVIEYSPLPLGKNGKVPRMLAEILPKSPESPKSPKVTKRSKRASERAESKKKKEAIERAPGPSDYYEEEGWY